MDPILQKGENHYERLKNELEPIHTGKYVAIELESGDYEIGNSREEAVDKINKKIPNKIPYSRKIGMIERVSRHYFDIKGNHGRAFRPC